MGESPKHWFDYYTIFGTNSQTKWWFGRKALMRGVSTEYTGEPAEKLGKELFGFCMKVQMQS